MISNNRCIEKGKIQSASDRTQYFSIHFQLEVYVCIEPLHKQFQIVLKKHIMSRIKSSEQIIKVGRTTNMPYGEQDEIYSL